MSLPWRLAILAIQLIILGSVSWAVTGRPIATESWYLAGLFAVVINPQLLEPFYPKPADVIGNGLIFLFFYAVERLQGFVSATAWAWNAAAILLGTAILLATIGVLFGLRKEEGPLSRLGRVARAISQQATARQIYSTVFLLSALQWRPQLDREFWVLVAGWVLIVLVGLINWQNVWATASGSSPHCRIEGSLGPSILLVSAVKLPPPGSWVKINHGNSDTIGVILSRIRRLTDIWGQIHIAEPGDWERLAAGATPRISTLEAPSSAFLGSVAAGSTEKSLTLLPTQPLEVGGKSFQFPTPLIKLPSTIKLSARESNVRR